jgi:hypothetical protein
MMMTLGCFCVVLGFMTPDPSYPVRAQAEIDRYIDLSAQVCAMRLQGWNRPASWAGVPSGQACFANSLPTSVPGEERSGYQRRSVLNAAVTLAAVGGPVLKMDENRRQLSRR